MALKLSVEKIDDVEEALRPLYVEKEGKIVLDLEGYEDPAPIKRTLESARRAERDRQRELDKWKGVGKTPDEIQAAFEKLTELETLAKNTPAEIENFKTQWLEKNQGTLTKLQKEAADAKAEAAALKVARDQDRLNAVIDRAISSVKGKMNPLRPIVRQFVQIQHEDGVAKFVVVDENGQPRYNVSGPNDGKQMTIPELLTELSQSEDYAGNFEGSGNSGAGSKPPAGGHKASPLGVKSKKDIPPGLPGAHKLAEFIRSFPSEEEGVKAYQALPD
jgi:hypothetical protein